MLKLCFILFCVIGLASCDRSNTFEWNPQCNAEPICAEADAKGSFNNLLYLKAEGANDTLHFLYSSIKSFTIMAFRTDLNSQISINYTNLISGDYEGSIEFSKAPKEFVGYSFPTIFEFNDEEGKADMGQIPNNSTFWQTYQTADLIWSNFTQVSGDKMGFFEGKLNTNDNSSFKFVLKYLGKDKRDDDLPHLLLNPDSFSADFVIDSIQAKFKDSKFGLSVFFLSENDEVSMSSERTLDDEYTPGTFKLWNVQIAEKASKLAKGFFQWKPIFYYYDPRSLENSTITKQYDLVAGLELPAGIGAAFFKNGTRVGGMNVSFGLEGDEKDGFFYMQSNYSVWTFSAGLGAAPVEKMSPIVTLVIFIGFGLPALVIVVGLVVMVVRKIRNSRRSSFERLE